MPRAACTDDSSSVQSATAELTTLKSPPVSAPDHVIPGQHAFVAQWENVHAVATAFLTNVSGGAACYDVDLGLVAEQAVTPELTQAIADMRRLMAFADVAGWTIMGGNPGDATGHVAVVVARATTGSGDDASTDSQEFTLQIDISSAAPITRVDVSERVNATRRPEFEIVATQDDVASMHAGTGTCAGMAWARRR